MAKSQFSGERPRRLATGSEGVASKHDNKTTMFYDGGCPICRREVAHYQRLDAAKRIRWVNIDGEPEALDAVGISHPEAMRRLHVLNREGELLKGAHAFATIWSELPYYRGVSQLVTHLRLLKPLELLYGLFARWRYSRLRSERGNAVRQRNDGKRGSFKTAS